MDLDQSGGVDRSELITLIEKGAYFPNTGHGIVTDGMWESLDKDGDGVLSSAEFSAASMRMSLHQLYVEPILVYPPQQLRFDYGFKTLQSIPEVVSGDTGDDAHHQVYSKACENFVLIRQNSSVLPYDSKTWNVWFNELHAAKNDPTSRLKECHSLDALEVETVVIGSGSGSHYVPLLASKPGTNAVFINPQAMEIHTAADAAVDLYTRVVREGLEMALSSLARFDDVIHEFDKQKPLSGIGNKTEDASNQFKDDAFVHTFSDKASVDVTSMRIVHKGAAEKTFADNTAVIIKGAVLFPKDWTMQSQCGLYEATVFVYEEGSNGKPDEYLSDESGWFEFALTRGKTYTITASYPNHVLCYTGQTTFDATRVQSCAGRPTQLTLRRVTDGNYIFFTDTTTSNIDLGLYQGECDALYKGASFKITPINGCHAPVVVTADDIKAWTLPDRVQSGDKASRIPSNDVVKNARRWRFAALDYSILLQESPPMTDLPSEKNKAYPNAQCEVDVTDAVQYFRARNALERLAPLRTENIWWEVRYKFHGYMCAEIMDIPRIQSDSNICYVENEELGLKRAHFLGSSDFFTPLLAPTKQLSAKVFELHLSGGVLSKCEVLPSTGSGGRTWVEIRQDVTDLADNECHYMRDGGPSCDFDVVIDDDGYLSFPPANGESARSRSMTITQGEPNLVGNHRRSVRVTAFRNDGFRVVPVYVTRPLITLGAKPRGGNQYGEYSDDVYWATVPLDGLVYSVVHDPPGGNSYAELMIGTEISMALEMSNERSASLSNSHSGGGGVSVKTELATGITVGYITAVNIELSMPIIEVDFDASHSETGPDFSLSSSVANSWDLTTTTSRAIRTSMDVSIPGRAGDVILGGGVELQYKMSDKLDLIPNDANVPCLDTTPVVTWLPRKPTSYIFGVHAIEAQVIPNLYYLLSVVQTGAVKDTSSGMVGGDQAGTWTTYLKDRIRSWQRTLEWSSPKVYHTATSGGDTEKNYEAVDRISKPILSEESLFGKFLNDEQSDEFYEYFNVPVSTLTDDIKTAWGKMADIDPNINGIQSSMSDASANIGKLSGNIETSSETGVMQKRTESDRRMPKMTEWLIEDDESYPTFGMNDATRDDLNSTLSSCTGSKCTSPSLDVESQLVSSPNVGTYKFGEVNDVDGEDSFARAIASFTGGTGKSGMRTTGNAKSTVETIYLTFSGGGHSTEYIYTSNEDAGGEDYSWTLSVSGTQENSYSLAMTLTVAKGHFDSGTALAKEVSQSRAFAWGKHERMSTLYALGDPEFGDKFVVQVGSDVRFGTPVFMTKGGRSKCPGEILTMFREEGVTINREPSFNVYLNPSENAVFQLKIINSSPFKERASVGLRLVDGVAECIQSIISAGYEAARSFPTNGARVLTAVEEFATSAACLSPDAEEVTKMRREATAAARENPTDALMVALRVARASQTARPAGSAMENMEFRINGVYLWAYGEVLPLKQIAGEHLYAQNVVRATEFILTAKRAEGTFVSKYIGLSVVSLCESQLESNMYRPIISNTVSLGEMTWSRACPKVAFTETTMSKDDSFWVRSMSTDSRVNMTIMNPDRYSLWPGGSMAEANPDVVNTNLAYVRLQYRPVVGGEWLTVKDQTSTEKDKKVNILCNHSRTDGCPMSWNLADPYEKLLSGYKDGTYEVRLKNFCPGGHYLAVNEVHEYTGEQRVQLKVDTKKPLISDMQFVEDQATYKVTFVEAIDCSSLKHSLLIFNRFSPDAKWLEVVDPYLAEYKPQCTNVAGVEGYWMLEFPWNAKGEFKVRVSGVTDMAGMEANDFTFQVALPAAGSSSSLGLENERRVERNPTAVATNGLGVQATPSPALRRRLELGVFAVALASAFAVAAFAFTIGARKRAQVSSTRAPRGETSTLLDADTKSQNTVYGAAV